MSDHLQQDTINEFGISRKWITAQYLKIISEALKSGKLGVMRQALDSLSDRLKVFNPISILLQTGKWMKRNWKAKSCSASLCCCIFKYCKYE